MPLTTVRVPPGMEGPFIDAEAIVSRYFHDRRDDPQHGTIEIFGERYVLLRAASLSVEFFALVEGLYGERRREEAHQFARNILFDVAHAVGKADAQAFHAKMGLVDPIAKLSAGPIHFAHAGWAFVDISPESRPSPNDDYYLLYDHPYSFEADAWLHAGKRLDAPACIMNAGYSSGWCEESFGVTLVAAEVLCRAKGDAACRFLMAHPDRIGAHVEQYGRRARTHADPTHIPDFFVRKRMDEELRRAKDELEARVRERTAELVSSNERLKHEMEQRQKAERQLLQTHKLEAIGRLAGGIAHDFNNVMAVILASGGLLARKLDDDDPRRALVDQITQAAERASKLTQQLLAFGRGQAIGREVVDVSDVVRGLAPMLDRVLGETVRLESALSDEACCVAADRGQIEQVLMNLIVNARDAMPQGGVVRVETARATLDAAAAAEIGVAPGEVVRVDVVDQGIGMSDETLAQIFDPFFTTKAVGKGTGLGLSTVYGIVRQAGGGIAVKSAPGVGSRFALYLPRVARAASEAPPPRVVEDRAGAAPGRGATVLLVEDQPALRRVIEEVLQDLGYDVVSAGDADAALAGARDRAIDALLTDVVMPQVSGPELAERVAALRPGVKVLFMSGHVDAQSREEIGRGKAPVLAKPFTPEQLAAALRGVLGG